MKSEITNSMTNTEEDKQIPMPEQTVSLTIGDIDYCKQIIEKACEKGAFKEEEMAVVGVTYNRISKWLEENRPNLENQTTEAEETSKAQGETKDD